MRVHGVVIVDLRHITSATAAKAALWDALCDTPSGIDVRLAVPRWDWWAPFALDLLLEHNRQIGSISVEGDARTVRRWVVGLRQGSRHLHAVGGE